MVLWAQVKFGRSFPEVHETFHRRRLALLLLRGLFFGGPGPVDLLSTAEGASSKDQRRIKTLTRQNRELLTARQFAFSCEQMSECGRMLGGWIRQASGTDEAA